MVEAEKEKDRQLEQIQRKNKDELMRVSAEAMEKTELMEAMHAEAMARTKEEIRALEKQQENYLKIIEKKHYESTYPKPLRLENHQKAHPKAFYIQILGCRGAGKSTFLNRFFHLTGLRKLLETPFIVN